MTDLKVLVTGTTGFIGSHLVPRLVEQGHKVLRGRDGSMFLGRGGMSSAVSYSYDHPQEVI